MRALALVGITDAGLPAALEAERFVVSRFDNGLISSAVRERVFAVVLLELGEVAGIELCRDLATDHRVIAVTSEPGDEECLLAFGAGAVDCVRSPYAHREVIARVRNLLRRVEPCHDKSGEQRSGMIASLESMRVRAGNRTIDLTRGEAAILRILLERAPAPVNVAQIAELLSQITPLSRRTVESRIKSLRRKLGAEHLVTRVRIGYQLANVESVDEESDLRNAER